MREDEVEVPPSLSIRQGSVLYGTSWHTTRANAVAGHIPSFSSAGGLRIPTARALDQLGMSRAEAARRLAALADGGAA